MFIQAIISGVAAEALIGGILLDQFLKVSDLIQKQQNALEIEAKEYLKQL